MRLPAVLFALTAAAALAPPTLAQSGRGSTDTFVFGQTLYTSANAPVVEGDTFLFGQTTYVEGAALDGDPVDDVCVWLDPSLADLVEGAPAAVSGGDRVEVGTAASEDSCAAAGGIWFGSSLQVDDAEIAVDGAVSGGPKLGHITLKVNADGAPQDGFVIIDNIDG